LKISIPAFLNVLEKPRKDLLLHAVEALYGLLLLVWFFLPLFAGKKAWLVPPLLPLSFLDAAHREIVPFLLVTCVVYPIPLVAAWKVVAAFLEHAVPSIADPTRVPAILLNVLGSSLVLATLVIHLILTAESPEYFRSLPLLTYAVFFASLACNAGSLAAMIVTRNRGDPEYRDYIRFKRYSRARGKGIQAALGRWGIQRRLALTLFPFIIAIIVIPAVVLMRDFCRTVLDSAISYGKDLAERTANIVRASSGDPDSIDDYLSFEARRNWGAKIPFLAISFSRRDAKNESYKVNASTDRFRVGKQARRPASLSRAGYRYLYGGDSLEFYAPVVLSSGLAGYVAVEYSRQVIYEPYFRTEVKVIIMAAVAIYAAIFVTYLFGKNIAFPILLVCMSVSSISQTLAGMIKGKTRIAAGLLQYKDRVRTDDEIKMLSSEVRSMTYVIRGLVPYISVSTLTHAEREEPKTVRKNLAFIFTDIRGFTTLCEGRDPDWIVEMLNRYLEIQSGIILSHGGDIDKFVGDEIMAMFKGQGRELAACRASVEIRSAMAAEKELAELASRHVISIGIGIHSGPVVFGSVGAKERKDFTSIGDTVNLAARLEAANKNYGTKTLVSEAVHEKVKDDFLCREIDLLRVKGKRQPVRIFELLQRREKASDRIHEMSRIFQEGLTLYRRQKWEAAEKPFAFLREKYKDETSVVFLRRIELFKGNPPPQDWDGVFDLLVK
jgi:adenylate cyclase